MKFRLIFRIFEKEILVSDTQHYFPDFLSEFPNHRLLIFLQRMAQNLFFVSSSSSGRCFKTCLFENSKQTKRWWLFADTGSAVHSRTTEMSRVKEIFKISFQLYNLRIRLTQHLFEQDIHSRKSKVKVKQKSALKKQFHQHHHITPDRSQQRAQGQSIPPAIRYLHGMMFQHRNQDTLNKPSVSREIQEFLLEKCVLNH